MLAAFKRLIAAEVNFDPWLLRYTENFLAYLRAEKARSGLSPPQTSRSLTPKAIISVSR